MLVASDHAWSRSCGTALATMIRAEASQPLSTLDANGYTGLNGGLGPDRELGQRHRVVPVVELPRRLVALQLLDARQRQLDPRRRLAPGDQAEVAGGERRPQVHPDVRRRRVLGAAARAQVAVDVVGRQSGARLDHRLERVPRVGGVPLERAIAAGRTGGAERRGQREGEGEGAARTRMRRMVRSFRSIT